MKNGKVKKNHKIDTEKLNHKQKFTFLDDLIKKIKRYESRYNNILRKVFGFKFINEIV